MSQMWGADIGELEQLAGRFEQGAGLIDGLTVNIGRMLLGTAWLGADADRFRSQWTGHDGAALTGVASALRQAALTLRQAAKLQGIASEAIGGGLGVVAGGGVLLGSTGAGGGAGAEPKPWNPDPSSWWNPFSWGNKSNAPGLEPFTGPLFNGDGPSSTDVDQGQLGDCYLASTAASLAQTDPHALEQLIHDNGNGTYTVTFHGPNGPSSVTVDGELYAKNGSPLYGKQGNGAMWFPILEKAYAQWKGSYDNIGNGGYPTDVMSALTGRQTSSGNLGGFMGMSDGDAWNQIQSSVNSHQLVTATTDSVPDGSGLVGDHAYTVVGYTSLPDGSQWVTVRNPWGTSPPPPSGEGSMTVDDFRSNFANLQWTQ